MFPIPGMWLSSALIKRKHLYPMFMNFILNLYRKKLFKMASVTLMLIFLCSFAVFYFEHGESEANIRSLWDSFWWAIVTV
ncbi:MAG: hypothetical protein Q7J65_07800, partial [Candidatus Marinimicrobia bacterium]|nr:hypothetical protein [Candidatus Neomarinimicrobiota bacterium]